MLQAQHYEAMLEKMSQNGNLRPRAGLQLKLSSGSYSAMVGKPEIITITLMNDGPAVRTGTFCPHSK